MFQFFSLANKLLSSNSQDSAAKVMSDYHTASSQKLALDKNIEENNNLSNINENDNSQTELLSVETSGHTDNSSNRNLTLEEEDLVPTRLKLVIILSGKRKSGKDHISTLITNYIGFARTRHVAILRIASPIKNQFAQNNKLNFERLLDSSAYKENYRLTMVDWSEKQREQVGWNCFLKAAIKEQNAKHKSIWILNDARRLCDIDFFENDPAFENVKLIKIRIEASDTVRVSRGWQYVEGIDDRQTECGLDDYDDWSYIINNNYNDYEQSLIDSLKPIFDSIDLALEEQTF